MTKLDKIVKDMIEHANNAGTEVKEKKIYICKEYVKSKYDNLCANCNSNKSYCNYSRQ